MIIMSTHLLHFKPDDNHHDTSPASPAVIMIIMSTHLLHLACSSLLQLLSEKRDDAEHRDDDLVATLPVRLAFGEGVGGFRLIPPPAKW